MRREGYELIDQQTQRDHAEAMPKTATCIEEPIEYLVVDVPEANLGRGHVD